jgi:glycine dehydrogenase
MNTFTQPDDPASATTSTLPAWDKGPDTEFAARHIGLTAADEQAMLAKIGFTTRAELINQIIPTSIRRTRSSMTLPAAISESQALSEMRAIAAQNQVLRSNIGQGYYRCHTPGVILRNVLENPAWYTAYTPYQAEISQGRLEALINFQTMVTDLTGLAVAGASMLDEATAAAEAMTLAKRSSKSDSNIIYVDTEVLPQTLAVMRTRAEPLGLEVRLCTGDQALQEPSFAVLLQYPGASGVVRDDRAWIQAYKASTQASGQAGFVIVAADLLALTLLKSPGEIGADIAVGTTQRFGMPLCNGGPHAAYLACSDALKRAMPGRLVGVSKDVHGQTGYRLALQTREQHIRREKATSNICTAQVLPAVVASMYAVYHGPVGLKAIARRIACLTSTLHAGLVTIGAQVVNTTGFDTLTILAGERTTALLAQARKQGVNLREAGADRVGISLDETTELNDVQNLLSVVAAVWNVPAPLVNADTASLPLLPASLLRQSTFLTHPVFNTHHSETSMLRYLRALSDKDLALDRTMIPLGSCTMKLNATSEMIPITWPEFADIHPYAPADQRKGYALLDQQLRNWLCEITGYAGVSLQPNAGSQGEYAGLLAVRAFHKSKGQAQRDVCLIPSSAHGTNPASAQMAGMKVVVTACDAHGNVDMADLAAKCEQYSQQLAVVMITYPSTHGVFESEIKRLCEIVHHHGGKVYIDGANMNALVGLAAPGQFGGDVSHLNLHKTFCIPHGGGGPGVGPVCVGADLVPYLPGNDLNDPSGLVSAAPLGNAAVLPISWMYIRMMGPDGLTAATETAILSANYISHQLKDHYPTLYSSENGLVAHECILDLRPLKESSGGAEGVSAEDVAKRLIDYGFHAPTLSFPVAGTLMVEPTESEPLAELDRFVTAMVAIREEIAQVASGAWPVQDNPLKNAPHTAYSLMAADWQHPYSREVAAYPLASLRQGKYWPPVGRIDNVFGDRNLFCSCPPIETYTG